MAIAAIIAIAIIIATPPVATAEKATNPFIALRPIFFA